jgi:hypothetical protein
MANIVIQAHVDALSTNEQAGLGGFTHAASFGNSTTNPLADSVNDEDIIFNLFTVPAGSVMVKWALVLSPAFSKTGDTAFNDTKFTFGDDNSTTRYLNGVQMNVNGTEVLYTYGNTAFVYTPGTYTLQVLIESMTAKKLSELNNGKAVLLFEIAPLQTAADAMQI